MKVLRLGNSDDLVPGVPEEQRSWRIAERMLAARTGEPVETVIHTIWPNDRLVAKVEQWLAEEQPDIVFFKVSNFAISHPSVAVRLQRRVPVVGPWLGRTGKKAADNPAIGKRPAFRWLQRAALRVIGGETHVDADTGIAIFSACIRRIVSDEEVVLVVRGSDGGRRVPGLSPKGARAAEVCRLKVHFAMKALCESLHVAYFGREKVRTEAEHALLLDQDNFHRGAAGQAVAGEDDGAAMAEAWLAAHGRTPHPSAASL